MKRKFLQKIGVAMISGVMVVSALAGCGNNTAKESTTAAQSSGESTSAQAQGESKTDGPDYSGVKLVYWSSWEATEPNRCRDRGRV